ncbi:MAG: tyrosine-type recombinase/integrase, partial [Dermatophilaceae bacterium]
MAWIEERTRADGGVSACVVWREEGHRGSPRQRETFSVGTDAQNRARAEGFKQMVDAAGQYWPEGWVKGEGFVRPREDNRYEATPSFAGIGEEYVRQIVELSPGQRKRYLSQICTLVEVEVRGVRIFQRAIDAITERDIKAWLIDWDRALKTKANYHGLLFGVFTYAVEEGYLSTNPCARTAPKRSRVRQSQAELRFLTEDELSTAVRLAGENGDLLTFAVGTGLRFGEVTALWCSDVDLTRGTVRVNKAWKRDGEN